MLAILASRLDLAARDLVSAWSSADTALVSAEDLCSEGWTFRVADPGGGTAVVDGRRVRVRELRAVVTRRPAVVAEELAWIDPADRSYVAAETNAFLVAWLDALPCKVVNRPTPTSLCGPSWEPVHWAAAAAEVGMPWTVENGAESHDVVVIGDRCLGARSPAERRGAVALARTADVELLGVRFTEQGAHAATARPSLNEESVRATLLDHLLRGTT